MKILRACYDWRVLLALGAIAIGIYLVAPGLVAAALPLLVLAACPLSMLLMMKATGRQHETPTEAPNAVGVDRIAAVRQELAALGRRQAELADELQAIEASRREGPDGQPALTAGPRPVAAVAGEDSTKGL